MLEVLTVVLLGVATAGTAWCGYQATRWNGESNRIARQSSDERIEASRLFGLATQAVAFDANLVAQYAEAVRDGDEDLQRFFRDTLFREEFLPVLDAWEEQIDDGGGPPPRLLDDDAYLDGELSAYRDTTAVADELASEAEEAGENADQYVVITLTLAAALFFAGITGSFQVRVARLLLLAMASVVLAYSLAQMASLPVV